MIGYIKQMKIEDSNVREMFNKAIDVIVDMMYLCRDDLETVNHYMLLFTGYEMAMNALGYHMTAQFKNGLRCSGIESVTLASFDGKVIAVYEYTR